MTRDLQHPIFVWPVVLAAVLLVFDGPVQAADYWQLEADTVITLPSKSGNSPGSCTLKKGTRVELRSPANANELELSFAGLVFSMPRGEALQEAFALLYPQATDTAGLVFDIDAWENRRSLPPGEAQWLPLAPRPEDPRKKHWDPRGFFAIPDAPRVDAAGEKDPPRGFAWDRTLIIPGRFAFLNLPFILQKKPGICVGAAGINVVRYLCPDNPLTGPEFFRLLTERSHGASYTELKTGLELLGMPSDKLVLTRSNLLSSLRRVKANLDLNLPVLAADRRHMVLITGYDATAKKLFVWNQWGNGKVINGMPKGHYELQDRDLAIEFKDLVFCRKVRYEPADNVKQAIEQIAGPAEDLQMHPFIESEIPAEYFLPHAGPERLRVSLRSGRMVLVPQGASVLAILPDAAPAQEQFTCVYLPGKEKYKRTLRQIADEIAATNGGTFYSAKKFTLPDNVASASSR